MEVKDDQLRVQGGRRLQGEVFISGAKNAAVAILPAAVMADGVCQIENLPDIEDVHSLFTTINRIGARCEFVDAHTLRIDARGVESLCATYDEVRKIRASYYLLGALLGRYKKAAVALPGGCNFGSRPIDLHIKGFEALGAKVRVDEEQGIVYAEADRLVGASVYLDVVSVGATINVMLAASMAEGVTTIENAAKEPHVVDTANFLNIMGANIKGAGTDVIRITGVPRLHDAQYTIIPDQIEAGTYMIAGAITGGDVTVRNIIPKHMDSLTAKLEEMNVGIEEGDDYIRVIGHGTPRCTNIRTMSYPGFPTDLQPQMVALLSCCQGESKVIENVWENRYQYTRELNKMGAQIAVDGRVATITGVARLLGAQVEATDLRAGAAMILAGLAAEGETTISQVRFIDRGYEDVEQKFLALGADICRIKA